MEPGDDDDDDDDDKDHDLDHHSAIIMMLDVIKPTENILLEIQLNSSFASFERILRIRT